MDRWEKPGELWPETVGRDKGSRCNHWSQEVGTDHDEVQKLSGKQPTHRRALLQIILITFCYYHHSFKLRQNSPLKMAFGSY